MEEAEDYKLTVAHSDGESLVVDLNLGNCHDMHEELKLRSACNRTWRLLATRARGKRTETSQFRHQSK